MCMRPAQSHNWRQSEGHVLQDKANPDGWVQSLMLTFCLDISELRPSARLSIDSAIDLSTPSSTLIITPARPSPTDPSRSR
jgi:hypothetical protein